MHHHGGAGAEGAAWVNLLPLWLQVAWVLVLTCVTAWSAIALFFVDGSLRLAAALHTLAGVGMLDMFAPWAGGSGRDRFWQVTFGLATVVAVGGLVQAYRVRLRTRPTVAMWALVTLDSAAMTYMFGMVDGEFWLLTYALVAVFVLLSVGWAYGVFDTAHAPMCRQLPPMFANGTPARTARVVQASMAASMAYMFVLMHPGSGEFFGNAFTQGLTTQTYWALAFLGLGARVAFDPRLVRQLMGGFSLIARRPTAAAPVVAVREPVREHHRETAPLLLATETTV